MPQDEKRPADGEDEDEEETEDEKSEEKGAPPKPEEDADDEDDDEGDDDEDDDEPPPPPKKAAPKREEKPAPASAKKRPAPARFQLPPESSIGAPSRQTLVMLGVMAFATLAMWGSAKFACNAHPAQTRKPREVTTQELSRDPKDAALEMQQRWNAYDFMGALELAKGSMAQELEKAQGDCEKDKAACDAKRKEVGQKTLATAVLLDRGPTSAKVRVSSRGGALGDQSIVYQVEQEGPMWKVSGRTTADAPRPSATTPTTAAPSAAPSAAPAPSAGIEVPKKKIMVPKTIGAPGAAPPKAPPAATPAAP